MSDLRCSSSDDGNMLTVSWAAPSHNPEAVSSYVVVLHEYSPVEGSRELQLISIDSQELDSGADEAVFTSGLSKWWADCIVFVLDIVCSFLSYV